MSLSDLLTRDPTLNAIWESLRPWEKLCEGVQTRDPLTLSAVADRLEEAGEQPLASAFRYAAAVLSSACIIWARSQ